MPRYPIPQEMIDYIVLFVSLDENTRRRVLALKACALTSYAFWTAARRHLFSKVTLIDNAGTSTPQNLWAERRLGQLCDILLGDKRIVSTSYRYIPSIPRCIKMLTIQPSNPRHRSIRKEDLGLLHLLPSLLPTIFDELLPTIRMLVIFNPHPEVSEWKYWDRLVGNFIVSQPIVDLRISGVSGFPLRLLSHCHSLKTVFMHGVQQPTLAALSRAFFAGSAQPAAAKPSLDSVSFTLSAKVLSKLLGHTGAQLIDVSSIRTLAISQDELRVPRVTDMISLPSLSHLTIVVPTDRRGECFKSLCMLG